MKVARAQLLENNVHYESVNDVKPVKFNTFIWKFMKILKNCQQDSGLLLLKYVFSDFILLVPIDCNFDKIVETALNWIGSMYIT